MAFSARMSTVWVTVINAGQRVLEGRRWLPRSVDRTTVSALLKEIEFHFEQFENVAIIVNHCGNPPILPTLSAACRCFASQFCCLAAFSIAMYMPNTLRIIP